MRIYTLGFVGLFFVFGSAHAVQSSPPSDSSIHELLQVTQTHKMLDAMQAQIDSMLKKVTHQATGGQPVDAGEQKIIDTQTSKLNNVLMQQISWSKLEPMYIDIYRKSFTQKEVDDMLVFYKSPSGQSMIEKMPVVMAQAMQTMQGEMATLMPQIQKITEDTANSLRAYEASKKNSSKHSSDGAGSDNK